MHVKICLSTKNKNTGKKKTSHLSKNKTFRNFFRKKQNVLIFVCFQGKTLLFFWKFYQKNKIILKVWNVSIFFEILIFKTKFLKISNFKNLQKGKKITLVVTVVGLYCFLQCRGRGGGYRLRSLWTIPN